jgi:hypothetical protein
MAVEYYKKGGIGVGAFNFQDLAKLKASSKDYQDRQLLTFGGDNFFYFDKSDTASADNGGTVFVDDRGRRLKRVWDEHTGLSVDFFGAVGDGVTDDSGAIQSALNASAAIGIKVKFSYGRTYFVSSSLNIPKNLTNTGRTILIEGYGARIKTDRAITIFNRTVADNTEANIVIKESVVIKGLEFKGSGLAGQVGIFLAATYGAVIEDCYFDGLDVAADLAFCLMARINKCFATNCITDNFVLRTGDGLWAGGTTANSQCNHTLISQCRVYGKLGAFSHFRVMASSGVKIEGCISEGADPQYAIYYNVQNVTVVKDFTIERTHIENSPTKAGVFLRPNGGFVRTKGVFAQYAQVLFEVENNGYASIFMEDIPFIAVGTTFKYNGASGMFFLDRCTDTIYDESIWKNTTLLSTDPNYSKFPFYFSGRGIGADGYKTIASSSTKHSHSGSLDVIGQFSASSVKPGGGKILGKILSEIHKPAITVKAGESVYITVVPTEQNWSVERHMVEVNWNYGSPLATNTICARAATTGNGSLRLLLVNHGATDNYIDNVRITTFQIH